MRRIVHDMRNPLAAIVAHAGNLRAGPGGDLAAQNTAAIIENEAGRLTRLVDSLLFDARLSYVPPALEMIDLGDLLEAVYYQYDERAAREGKRMEIEKPPEPALAEVDHDLLVRALGNLIDNSLKYTPPGGSIALSLEVEPDQYRLKVTDTGEGIPPEYLPDRIFEALVRARPRDGGSGLGLSIVRKIAELHGGSVHAESIRGAGTTLTLCLPR
jgi:signal transduction histidine kinase